MRRTEQERALRMLDVLHSLRANFPDKIRMGVKDKGRVVFVDAREMVSAEAHGNYVLLRSTAGTHLLRETLAAVATLLAPYGFLRIHRSVLINTAFVEAIEPGPGGEWVVRTRTGSEYHVTRTYRRNLRGLAKCWLGTDEFASN
ncbi:MAG: LytTR family transcriptional regulator DNA-binding domain-containing protein [Gammaproteobacteria bacterium]|nr:LytTR family transcriptional regulator DNA-binding domain-containing protein [Gammaproteobacteria bacterium]